MNYSVRWLFLLFLQQLLPTKGIFFGTMPVRKGGLVYFVGICKRLTCACNTGVVQKFRLVCHDVWIVVHLKCLDS